MSLCILGHRGCVLLEILLLFMLHTMLSYCVTFVASTSPIGPSKVSMEELLCKPGVATMAVPEIVKATSGRNVAIALVVSA